MILKKHVAQGDRVHLQTTQSGKIFGQITNYDEYGVVIDSEGYHRVYLPWTSVGALTILNDDDEKDEGPERVATAL